MFGIGQTGKNLGSPERPAPLPEAFTRARVEERRNQNAA
jgi:hypothetical protein